MVAEANTQSAQAANQKVLDRLARVVRRADNFVLGFVKCNHLPQQQEMRQAFLARLANKRVLEIELDQDKPIVSLLDEITLRWDTANPPDVVCVYGLRHSIQAQDSPVLGRLNNDRELIRRSVPVPLLIWLPDYALDFVARGAPDFWAWRSGVYEFLTERALWRSDSIIALAPDPSILSSLNLQEKQNEITRLEELLRTESSLPDPDKHERKIKAGLLYQLGVLHDSLSEWQIAKLKFEECLFISRQIIDLPLEAITLHYLGIVNQHLGHFDVAKNLYEQSLKLKKKWGHPKALSSPYHQLGKIAYAQGNLTEAKNLYEQSLQIAQENSDQVGVAMALHHLGMLAHDQGDLAEAAQLYKECLTLSEKLDAKDITVNTTHQLGLLEHDRGNLLGAERLYNRSLILSEQIGDKIGTGMTYYVIADLREEQGDIQTALFTYIKALTIFRELHSFNEERYTQQHIQHIRGQIGEEQFQAWLRGKHGKRLAYRITEELDKEAAELKVAA